MKADEVALVGYLVHEIPELQPLLQEHLDDYGGLLPHVWMGDLTRWSIAKFRTNPSDASLKGVLDLVERALRPEGSKFERELVSASFVENLPRPEGHEVSILDLVGPLTQAQLRLSG